MPDPTPPNEFAAIFAALYGSTQSLLTANGALVQLAEHLTTATTATQHARNEALDTRETVHRLETLLLDLQRQIRDLKHP